MGGGSLVVELISGNETLWRNNISASSSRSYQDEINDETVRKSMIEDLTRKMDTMPIPYFVPNSKDDVMLPVVIQ